jgi:hypothetical protein
LADAFVGSVGNPCKLEADNTYSQNYGGLYCNCHRPYPDPERATPEVMVQCVICEDWLHEEHISKDVVEAPDANSSEEKDAVAKTEKDAAVETDEESPSGEDGEAALDATHALNPESFDELICWPTQWSTPIRGSTREKLHPLLKKRPRRRRPTRRRAF